MSLPFATRPPWQKSPGARNQIFFSLLSFSVLLLLFISPKSAKRKSPNLTSLRSAQVCHLFNRSSLKSSFLLLVSSLRSANLSLWLHHYDPGGAYVIVVFLTVFVVGSLLIIALMVGLAIVCEHGSFHVLFRIPLIRRRCRRRGVF